MDCAGERNCAMKRVTQVRGLHSEEGYAGEGDFTAKREASATGWEKGRPVVTSIHIIPAI